MAYIKTTVIFFCVLFTCILAQCPPEQLILPCNCIEVVFPVVECGKIYDMEVLVKVFERSADRQFQSFTLYDSSLMYLPADAISSKQFVTLMIVNSTMTALFDSKPTEDNQVDSIILLNVRFHREVGFQLFKNLKGLKLFRAENTEIKSLGKSFVENMNPELTNLRLIDAKVKKIYPNAFQNLGQLFDLQITNSYVKELKRSMFASPSALKKMNFGGNEIESLPDDIFSEMPRLEKVSLNGNKISTVSQAALRKVLGHLLKLNLEDNPLKCDCTIKWYVINDRKVLDGRCDYPEDKKGRKIEDLKAADFNYC